MPLSSSRMKMTEDQDEVKVVESYMVTPKEETPKKGLYLSPVDLMQFHLKRGHTPTIYLYRGAGAAVDNFFDVARLKAALAKALVAFYPLAGRLGMDGDGRAEIDCSGQGVLFVVARSDLTVDELISFPPSPELRRLFVPRVEDYSPPLMCGVQVNLLKCGGVALGTALHHVAIDAMSAFHFFQTWSALCRDGDDGVALELPCHDRTLLRARSPPVIHPDVDLTMSCPKLPSPVPVSEAPSGAVVNKILVVSKDQIVSLKRACGEASVSTFCAISAHLWRCLCVARGLPPDATARLTFPANIRRCLRPPLPDTYFGNGLIVLGATGKVQDIVGLDELASVACRIKDAIRRMDDELVRSWMDYLEMAGSNVALPPGSMPHNELRVTSWRGMPVYDADFGWGKPLVMHRAVQPRAGFAYLMDGIHGSMRILLSIEAAILDDFERMLYAIL